MKLFSLWNWLFPLHFYQTNVAAAVIGSAVVGGVVSANASSKASKAQGNAAAQADATQRYMYDTTREDNKPFRENGVAGNNRLAYLLGIGSSPTGVVVGSNPLTMGDQTAANNDPNYGSLLRNFGQADLDSDVVYQNGLQFGLNEGRKGLERMATANGNGLMSGATLKALTRFGNDYGSTKANDSFNRFNVNKQNTYNMLSGISGSGQMATNQVSAAGQNMANNVSANQIGMGNARAASAIGQSNALTGAIGQGWNMYQQNQLYNSLGNSSSGYNNEMMRLNSQANANPY